MSSSQLNSSQPTQRTAAVFGAGIAGLAAAHELIKAGYAVTVYECDAVPGGFARSGRTPDNMPTEYSWRGFGPWYNNTFEIMQQIPNRLHDGKTVFDTELSRQVYFAVVPDELTKLERNVRSSLTFQDYLAMTLVTLRTLVADKRSHEFYSSLNAAEYFKSRLTHKAWLAVVSAFGPWIGTDSARTSLHHVGSFHRKNAFPMSSHSHPEDDVGGAWRHGPREGWLLLRGPSSEVWFDPWVKHLASLGVQFKFNHRLELFKQEDGGSKSIRGALVTTTDEESKEPRSELVYADEYILAITPFASAKIAAASDELIRNDTEMSKFPKLIQDGPHIQISFRIGFKEKISFAAYRHKAFIMRDSEFNLTLFPDDAIFPADIALGKEVKSLWTGTACCSYVPGELFGLSASQCTREQFIKEVLHQLFRSRSLDEMIAKANGGRSLKTFAIAETEVWHSWQFPEESNGYTHVTAPQAKWVTSCKTHPYQPSCTTGVVNLKLAGAHTRTDADLWSMEGACESGKRAARAVVGDGLAGGYQVGIRKQKTPCLIRLMWRVDNCLWACGMPNLADVLVFCLFLVVLLTIVVTPTVVVLSRK